MTTSVIVEVPSKANYRARVTTTDSYTAVTTTSETFVEPSEKWTFYASNSCLVHVSEVPLAAAADDTPTAA